MVWNSLVIASIPSLLVAFETVVWTQPTTWIPLHLALCLLGTSYSMYFCLVYYTGARPAEHFSKQKRPDYAKYQQTTNCFFPGPSRA
mmetsp:Transcript_52545/g.122911  ORF Transcript_52545/g.122911 Transcript_52545/m.122911 type:complete len:87 (+) Transcript_52545:727-987(+)